MSFEFAKMETHAGSCLSAYLDLCWSSLECLAGPNDGSIWVRTLAAPVVGHVVFAVRDAGRVIVDLGGLAVLVELASPQCSNEGVWMTVVELLR